MVYAALPYPTPNMPNVGMPCLDLNLVLKSVVNLLPVDSAYLCLPVVGYSEQHCDRLLRFYPNA